MVGSILVIYNAIGRIISPAEINYNGMIIFAVVGVILNFVADYCTREGNSINQKAVNIHMLEDVIREELEEHNICHAILETETEVCNEKECQPHLYKEEGHSHHNH